jgi:hypothetical protein
MQQRTLQMVLSWLLQMNIITVTQYNELLTKSLPYLKR